MINSAQDLIVAWEKVINRLIFLEKRNVFQCAGLPLHPSEIHVLLAVRAEPKANTTRLAAYLGITKGAVSQVLKRLEAKGIIVKQVDFSQKNEVTVSFTASGQKAIAAFLAKRRVSQQRLNSYLASLSDFERETIRRFIDQLGTFLPSGK